MTEEPPSPYQGGETPVRRPHENPYDPRRRENHGYDFPYNKTR